MDLGSIVTTILVGAVVGFLGRLVVRRAPTSYAARPKPAE
jgi:uncharacterized membrane protein YeaQ/YmgE (transglycosylase-associated protein family)